MSVVYTPPGVSVQEFTSPSTQPVIATPGSICLVGLSAGGIQRTDPLILNGTSPTLLPGVPAGSTMSTSAILAVMDATNPSNAPNGYSASTDYTFSNTNFTLTRQVTSSTLGSQAASGQATATLSAGPVPAIGQVISVGNTQTIFTATTTKDSNTLTGVSTLSGLAVGQTLTGSGITGGTTILNLNSSNSSITMSNAASANGAAISLTSQLLELGTVLGVAGQVVTFTANLLATHANSSTVTWGNIPDGATVYVTYAYIPADYFQPIRLSNMADIQSRFGQAWDSTGNYINSTLSHAAMLAFENGATNLVLQAVYVVTNGVRVQPTASQFANPANWSVVLSGLRDYEDINIIVPVIGQSMANVNDAVQLQVIQTVQDHIEYQKQTNGLFLVGILGEDSSASSSVAQEATLISHAETLIPRYNTDVTQEVVLLNTSNFTRANRIGQFNLGGQYVAAGIAGMLASRKPSATLTRQVVSGITGVADQRSKDQKNNDAANGMLVVEQKGSIVQVRHGITLDATSVATQELSIVRSKHLVINSVRQTLDTQIIGRVVASQDAPTLINNAIIGTLEALRGANDIGGYSNIATSMVSLNPTIYQVRFSFAPLFPIDYINVGFTLDLTGGALNVTASGVTP